MSTPADKLIDIIANFEIYDGINGPYALIPEEDQISFDFIDPYELPGEVYDRLVEIGETQKKQKAKEKQKVKARNCQSVQANSVSHIVDPAQSKLLKNMPVKNMPVKNVPIKHVPITSVPIFSIETVVVELQQTDSARFQSKIEGFDWDALAHYLLVKSMPISDRADPVEPKAEYDSHDELDHSQMSSAEVNLMWALASNEDESLCEPAHKLERPQLVLDTESLSGDETARVRCLKHLYENNQSHRRRVLIADDAMIARLKTLSIQAPQFAVLIDLYSRAATLSHQMQTAFTVPPTVLLDPPGIGKTWIVRKLAEAIGSGFTKLAMNTNSDSGLLFGHPQSWRGAKQGQLSRALVACNTASPILFLDEIDKLQASGSLEDPYLPLLTLMETENAKDAMDEYLCIPFDLSHAIIIATANDISALSKPMLDRLLVVEIDPPNNAQRLNVVSSILTSIGQKYGDYLEVPNDEVMQHLAQTHPRQTIRLIELALGFMAEAGRKAISLDDVHAADALMQYGNKPSEFGFRSGQSL